MTKNNKKGKGKMPAQNALGARTPVSGSALSDTAPVGALSAAQSSGTAAQPALAARTPAAGLAPSHTAPVGAMSATQSSGAVASKPPLDFWHLTPAQRIDRMLDSDDMFRARIMLGFVLSLRGGLPESKRATWDGVMDWKEYERRLTMKAEASEVEVPCSGTSAIVAARSSGTQAHADMDTTLGHPATDLAVLGAAASSGMGNGSVPCTSTATNPALSYAGTYPLHLSCGFPTITPQPDMCSQADQIARHYEAMHGALHDTMTTVITKDSVIAKLQSRLDAAKGLKADLKDARAEVEKQRAAYLEEKKKNVKLNGKMKAEKEEMAVRIERLEREVKRHEREDGNAEGEFAKLQLAMDDAMQKHFVVKRERRESAEAEKNQMK